MFTGFFYLLRSTGIPVSIQEWLTLCKALDEGIIAPTLSDFYHVARALLVKNEAYFDHFDQAFACYFKHAEEPTVFKQELLKWLEEAKRLHLTADQLARLKKLNNEELRRLFEERLKEQKERHDGGDRWIGTGGTSPFGHAGVNPRGIRVSGEGGGRSAVQVATRRRFQDYRHDRVLDIRQIQVALRKLRVLARTGAEEELDLEETIDRTCRNAGEIDLVFKKPRKNTVKLLLLMDVGGSMTPFTHLVETLFSAAHQSNHFKRFAYFYFHNCIYEHVYRSASLRDGLPVPELLRTFGPEHLVILVGDAYMDPGELLEPYGSLYYYHRNETAGIEWLKRIKDHFQKSVWLNPENPDLWEGTSIEIVRQVFPMYPLTLEGLTEAVRALL